MKNLTDLNPRWVDYGGEGVTRTDGSSIPHQRGVGITFNCPCGCGDRAFVAFDVALDGSAYTQGNDPRWHRQGVTFNSLTLSPSIQRHKIGDDGCDWHGFIENGRTRDA